MKKIGFIDYYLDEWHANNYPAWIGESGRGDQFAVACAWAERDKPGGKTTSQWCEAFGVAQAPSREELIERCDCIVVLSPDNPERHEELAAPALKSGKPVYVDKTFAPDRAAAERMFDLAERHNTPLYSTSALRYAGELSWLGDNGIGQADVVFASVRGPGQFGNYAIHQVEMAVAAMGPGVRRAMAHGPGRAPVVVYEYRDGRLAVVNLLPWSGFSLALQAADGQGMARDIAGDFWGRFISAMLDFFETGKPPVPRAETCEAVAMVQAGAEALKRPGTWVELP